MDRFTIENIKLRLHIRYLLFLFALIISGLCIFACFLWPYNDNIAQKFSFAGTVSSIILSVLAIIVTLTGESKVNEAREKIDLSTAKLELVSDEIGTNFDNLRHILDQVEKLRDSINGRFDSMEMNLFEQFKGQSGIQCHPKSEEYTKSLQLVFDVICSTKVAREFLIALFCIYKLKDVKKARTAICDIFTKTGIIKGDRENADSYISMFMGLVLPFVGLVMYDDDFMKKVKRNMKELQISDLANQYFSQDTNFYAGYKTDHFGSPTETDFKI